MACDIANPLVPTHPLESLAWKSDYMLSEDSQTEFRDLLKGLHDILSQHVSKMARLQATLDQLLEERRSYVLRIDKLRSALAPHKKLPPELLSKIFKDCSPSPLRLPPLEKQTPSIVPMVVCSRWREIACNSRDLWSDVRIKYPNYVPDPRVKKEIVTLTRRAHEIIYRGTRSVRISLRSDYQSFPGDIDPLRNLITPLSQLIHINLRCPINHIYNFLRSSFPPFPFLESLVLQDQPNFTISPYHDDWEAIALFKNTPNLKILKILDFDYHLEDMPLSIPWNQLTKIDFGDTWVDARITHSFLSQCTSVVSCQLSLTYLHKDDPDHPPLTPIVLPHLRSLSIQDREKQVLFFDSLILPSLRSLYIPDLLVKDGPPWLYSLIPRSGCTLIDLSILYTPIPALLLDPLLELLPALEVLTIPSTIIPIPTLERISQGILLPQLMNINCTIQSSPYALESFMDAVERRGAEGLGATPLRDASTCFDLNVSDYETARWSRAIQRFNQLVEKLSKEGRSISLPELKRPS